MDQPDTRQGRKTPRTGAVETNGPAARAADGRGRAPAPGDPGPRRLLATLPRLLAIQAADVHTALDQASQLLVEAFAADKVDAFLYDPAIHSLVALGTSDTPMGREQHAHGLDRLPLANGGRTVEVYESGRAFLTGRAEDDPAVEPGVKHVLGVRSIIAVPLEIEGVRRGVLAVDAAQPDRFTPGDLDYLQAVSLWVGMVAQRAELLQRVRDEAAENARRVTAEQLITVLAHDLGNYLTPLKARIDLLLRHARSEGASPYIRDAEAARAAADRLDRLVKDLLDVGRLEQGLFGLNVEGANLAAIAREAAGGLHTRGHDIAVRGPAELWAAVDAARVRQALDNLLANAVKHSPAGAPVHVDLTTEARDSGAWAVITVRDEGPGVDPGLVPRLFTAFTPGPHSQSLGLGLYLAHGIATAHGGSLVLDAAAAAEHGGGAVFRLALPVDRTPTEF